MCAIPSSGNGGEISLSRLLLVGALSCVVFALAGCGNDLADQERVEKDILPICENFTGDENSISSLALTYSLVPWGQHDDESYKSTIVSDNAKKTNNQRIRVRDMTILNKFSGWWINSRHTLSLLFLDRQVNLLVNDQVVSKRNIVSCEIRGHFQNALEFIEHVKSTTNRSYYITASREETGAAHIAYGFQEGNARFQANVNVSEEDIDSYIPAFKGSRDVGGYVRLITNPQDGRQPRPSYRWLPRIVKTQETEIRPLLDRPLDASYSNMLISQ
jgi:hypothetical protein